jgi:hypothetical protein
MTESKKAWVTPELIVLVRSKPEEAVLGACKYTIERVSAVDNTSGCMKTYCQNCTDLVSRL